MPHEARRVEIGLRAVEGTPTVHQGIGRSKGVHSIILLIFELWKVIGIIKVMRLLKT